MTDSEKPQNKKMSMIEVELSQEIIELATELAVKKMRAEREFREFIADPIKARAFKEYIRMTELRLYKDNSSQAKCEDFPVTSPAKDKTITEVE